MTAKYSKRIDPQFLADLQHIKDSGLVDPTNWGLFKFQLESEWNQLDENWEKISRATDYPPLSTYGYRKRYMHSIPVRLKNRRNWTDKSSDFRIIFKVNEAENEIYYYGIGKRIKGLPKDPDDIWALLKNRKLPEEDE